MSSVRAMEIDTGAVRQQEVVEMEEAIQVRLTRLESDVQHIRTDVADIKVEVRRTNDRLDKLQDEIRGVDKELTDKIDVLRKDLTDKIDALAKDLASTKVWAVGLYVAQSASLLFVMAKGFKWL